LQAVKSDAAATARREWKMFFVCMIDICFL